MPSISFNMNVSMYLKAKQLIKYVASSFFNVVQIKFTLSNVSKRLQFVNLTSTKLSRIYL